MRIRSRPGGVGWTAAALLLPLLASPVGGGAVERSPETPRLHFNLTVTVVGNGRVQGDAPTEDSQFIDCPDFACTASIATDASMTLTATPAAGWIFDGWSGDCIGTGSCTVTMSQARSVRATFTPEGGAVPQSLLVSVQGPGTVNSSPPGIACPPSCSTTYEFGTTVSLTGTPGPGATFDGFGGECFGPGVCTLVMDRQRSVSARFTGPGFRLDVTVAGAGTVISEPPGVSCPLDCDETFPTGSAVTLTPLPAAGWRFVAWEGSCAGAGACVITMDRAHAVTARFEPGAFPLTVTVIGGGSVTSSPGGIACPGDCTEIYTGGSVVSLSANPAGGSLFAGWEGACTGTGSCAVLMTLARSVTARFSGQSHALSVSVTGSGTVTSSPAGIACPPTCSASFADGILATLVADPAAGWELSAWSGSCSGTGSCGIRMDGPRAAGAAFQLREVNVSLSVRGDGTVTSSPAGLSCPPQCDGSFPAGTPLTLSAAPGGDWSFAGWQGPCAGSGPCVLTLVDDVLVTARFTAANANVDRVSPGSALRVDGYDLALMMQAVSADDPRYDLNGDGRTDLNDLNVVLQALGTRP